MCGDDFDAEDKGDPTPLVVLPVGRPSSLAFAPLLGLRAVVVVQVGSSAVVEPPPAISARRSTSADGDGASARELMECVCDGEPVSSAVRVAYRWAGPVQRNGMMCFVVCHPVVIHARKWVAVGFSLFLRSRVSGLDCSQVNRLGRHSFLCASSAPLTVDVRWRPPAQAKVAKCYPTVSQSLL